MSALFEPAGPDRWVATALARGPWDERHCHGGPVAAILARAVEQYGGEGEGPWQVARITVELTRPVPVGVALAVTADVERAGRKVSLIGASIRDGDTEVARARVLRIRDTAVAIPADTVSAHDPPPSGPETGRHEAVDWAVTEMTAFHRDGSEHRFVEGSWTDPGPVVVWIRLIAAVVEGEEPSGVQRAVAAADFGNGVSGALPFERFRYINPDLTVHLVRPPQGEWIAMRAASYYGDRGAGLAESALYDSHGRVGRSVQSLFVEGG